MTDTMPPPGGSATTLIGLRIRLERTVDVPCGMCGETTVAIGPGVGPHVAGLHCAGCDRHRGWLSKAAFDFLTAMVAQFGKPTEPITVRNAQLQQFAEANPAASPGAPAAETPAP
jgi:hypothetical protein